MKNRKYAILVLFLLAVTLTACGGDKTKKGGGDTFESDGTSSDGPSYGGSVTVGVTQDLDSLDPHKAVAAGTKEILFNVFEGLVKPDESGNLVPAVASDYTISDDADRYTFTLRDGIRFHNGALVTVDDVIYSIKRCAGLLDSTESDVEREPALSNISDVKAVDGKTIEILLKKGDLELIGFLTCAIIPENYDGQSRSPVGTGPFRFVSYSPLNSFVIEKNEEYWDSERPYLDQVTFKIESNADSAFLELKNGTIDIFPYLTQDQADQLADSHTIAEGNMNLVQGLFLNNAEVPFDIPDVRKAVNYAIDKQGILDMVSGGKGHIIGSNMFPGFTKYYDGSLENFYGFDPEKAKELLKGAGYGGGLEFTITVPSNYAFHVDTAQVIVEQLKAVGINARIQKIEWSQWLKDVYTDRNYQATVIGLDAKLAPRNLLDRYDSAAANNFVNYKNDRFDGVLARAVESVDEQDKIQQYHEAQKLLTEDAASVFIQDPVLMVAVSKRLDGYRFYPVYVQDMASVYEK